MRAPPGPVQDLPPSALLVWHALNVMDAAEASREELVEQTGLAGSTLDDALQYLRSEGLVEHRQGSRDGRRRYYSLTAAASCDIRE